MERKNSIPLEDPPESESRQTSTSPSLKPIGERVTQTQSPTILASRVIFCSSSSLETLILVISSKRDDFGNAGNVRIEFLHGFHMHLMPSPTFLCIHPK